MRWLSWVLDLLFPPRDAELIARDATIESLSTLAVPTRIDEAVALLPYRNRVVQALVREAKFKDNRRAQQLLGQVLGAYLLDRYAPEFPLVIVPVPLSRKRALERGYNQTERIARAALDAVPHALLAPELLTRTRDTLSQTSLGRTERLQNIRGAFVASALDPDALYVVVDDVITTGGTLAAAVEALKEAGATQIHSVSLAH